MFDWLQVAEVFEGRADDVVASDPEGPITVRIMRLLALRALLMI